MQLDALFLRRVRALGVVDLHDVLRVELHILTIVGELHAAADAQPHADADLAKKLRRLALGHAAADEEIAGEIGIAAAELNEWQSQLKVTNVVSLNEFVEQGGEPVMDARGNSHFAQPEDNIEEEELKKVLSETMDLLTEKERKVILLYYYEELTLKEISNILEVSESRVSQLHTKALLKMRKKMGSYMGILTE